MVGGGRQERAGLAMGAAMCVGFLPIVAVTGQAVLEQLLREVAVREGDGITFQCSMSGDGMSHYNMFWYRLGPRGNLDVISQNDVAYGKGFQDRFKGSVEIVQNRFTLEIKAAKPGDQAVYYCAAGWGLEHVTAALIFGKGTELTVEPRHQNNSVPDLMVMKSKKPSGIEKAACLARNFYTKNISLEMSSEAVVYEPSTPFLTSDGSYDAIKVVNVTKGAEVSCKARLNGDLVTADQTESENEAEEPEIEKVCNTTDTSEADTKVEKANMLSMAVLGLRVLLAKSIAFNTLMSVKLFLF